MTTLKQIKGTAIQFLDEDPVLNVGTWSSGGTMNTARSDLAGLGVLTSAMAVAGYASPGTQSAVETYNGSSWTEITELNAARNSLGGFGATNTAAIACGGRSPTVANTEYWNGSSWTEVNDMNTARFAMNISGAGTQTSGLSSGGNGDAGQDTVEVWDGTNWTAAGAELNTTRGQGSASGQSSSSAAAVGGYGGSPDAPLATTELWNGSSWTEVADLNTARYSLVCTGDGTSLLVNGGQGAPPSILTSTESFDGTSWTEVNDLSNSIKDHGGSGYSSSNTTSLSFAGKSPSSSFHATSEEWAFPPSTSSVLQEGDMWFNSSSSALKGYGKAAGIPSGTWGSSANLNTARGDGLGGFGTTSLAGVTGGDTGVPGDSWVANTEIYNGSSWSEVADLNTAGYYMQGTAGTSTASITAGRRTSTNTNNVESWNGSSWTEVAEINTARRGAQSAQPASAVSAFLIFGGYTTTPLAVTESWNGSAWTETTDMNTAKYAFGGGGAGPSDAIACGGQGPPGGNSTEIWNGSSWTEVAEMNASKIEGASAGISTLLMYGGGNNPGATGLETCEVYNGSSWSEVNDLADGGNGASCHIGTATDCFFAGGISPTTPNAASASTEHFTADAAIATVTVS